MNPIFPVNISSVSFSEFNYYSKQNLRRMCSNKQKNIHEAQKETDVPHFTPNIQRKVQSTN